MLWEKITKDAMRNQENVNMDQCIVHFHRYNGCVVYRRETCVMSLCGRCLQV